jgi:hypothetical protein
VFCIRICPSSCSSDFRSIGLGIRLVLNEFNDGRDLQLANPLKPCLVGSNIAGRGLSFHLTK